jgi:hypothetical protein
MPVKIKQLADKILKDPAEVNIALAKPPEKILREFTLSFTGTKIGIG